MFVLVGVVSDPPLARKDLQLRRADHAAGRKPEYDHLEGIESAPQVAAAQHREIRQNLVVRAHQARTQAAFGILQGLLENPYDSLGRKRLQAKKVAPRQQRRIHIETRIVRGRPD